jgi:hypothetical protein
MIHAHKQGALPTVLRSDEIQNRKIRNLNIFVKLAVCDSTVHQSLISTMRQYNAIVMLILFPNIVFQVATS